MTLRILLQKLHKLAGEMGADTPVEVYGFSRRGKLHDVVAAADGPFPFAAIHVKGRNLSAQEKKVRNRARMAVLYEERKANGLCVKCAEPLPDTCLTERCPTCAAIQAQKDKERYFRKRATK